MTAPSDSDDYVEFKLNASNEVRLGPPKTLPNTYWVSRGRTHGVLDSTVQVWAVRPEFVRCDDGDLFWIAPLEVVDKQDTLLGEWTIGEAMRFIHNGVPDDELQCLRVGPEPVVVASERLVS